jgi:putative transcriptional regulator
LTAHPENEIHGLDALLASYAAGQLSPALHALVAAHLGLCRRNRAYVTALETIAATELTAAEPAPINRREEKLSAIFASPPAPTRFVADAPIPRALGHFIRQPFETIRWRQVRPGVRECLLEKKVDEAAALIWIRAGQRIPAQRHKGTEVTLVLQGGFRDQTGHYVRGDIAVADANASRRPIADPGEDCLCFAVIDGRMGATSPSAEPTICRNH